MELNREQIVKVLECCSKEHCGEWCAFYDETPCEAVLAQYALALIKELTEENERLHTSCTELTQCCTKLETLYKIKCKQLEVAEAKTVRKMHTEIKERCIKGGIYPAFVARTIENVAKEMLEEET